MKIQFYSYNIDYMDMGKFGIYNDIYNYDNKCTNCGFVENSITLSIRNYRRTTLSINDIFLYKNSQMQNSIKINQNFVFNNEFRSETITKKKF